MVSSWIMGTDYELPFAYDLHTGIDTRGRLTVSVEYTNLEKPAYNCCTWARLSPSETLRLARRLKTGLTRLPDTINRFISGIDEWSDNPERDEVIACFKDITERLLDEGSHFTIHRNAGLHGIICC